MAHQSWQQEHFSLAYVRAVASAAGFGAEETRIDVDGVDMSIHAYGESGDFLSPKLDVQVKSETSGKPAKFPWSYDLKVKNYNKLIAQNYATPRILIVVAMPKESDEWLTQSPAQLALRHCAYWVSLCGSPKSDNKDTVAVHLLKKQRFSPKELKRLLDIVGKGGHP